MAVDYRPVMGEYTELKPFRFWCQKVLPLVYDDSLSYYELLCKVVDYLNKTMEDVETLHGDVENLSEAYDQLQSYVNDYFDNLDVQEEINNKLDIMAQDGSLTSAIAPVIPDAVAEWLNQHISPTTPSIDNTLSVSGAGADAKTTGDNFAPIYSSTSTYKYGDIVLYNGRTYKNKLPITEPKAWANGDWELVSEARNVKNIESRVLNSELDDTIITSNNILDSRSAIGRYPAEISGERYYFGDSFGKTNTYSRSINYMLILEKADNNLDSIVMRWVRDDDTVSAIFFNFNTAVSIPSNAIGVEFIAYSNATASPITKMGLYAYKTNTVYDEYSEGTANWTGEDNILATAHNILELGANKQSTPGLITTNLGVSGGTYPQYYEYFDVSVVEGETYYISGTWYASGFLPYMLFYNDRIVYTVTGNNPSADTTYNTVIKIPKGVNRLLVNNAVTSNVGTVKLVTGMNVARNDTIAEDYDSTRTYSVNDLCYYNEKLYKCILAVTTPESFDANKWCATEVDIELESLYNIAYNTIDNAVISSNNILDFRAGENKLASELNGRAFYFGTGIDMTDSYQANMPCKIAIEKDGNNLTGISLRTIRYDGVLSNPITNFSNTVYMANQIGIVFYCDNTTPDSIVRNISIYPYRTKDVVDTYKLEPNTWYGSEQSPLVSLWDSLELSHDNEPTAGLVTGVLTVVNTQYPQYYGYYDVDVAEGELYAIEGVWYQAGYLPYMLCHNDRVMYKPTGNNPTGSDKIIRNIIRIPNGVNRIIVNNELTLTEGLCEKVVGFKKSSYSGKKIVWFGTSIPAGYVPASSGTLTQSYPNQIGNKLNCTVYNEAVGSSCVRGGNHYAVTSNDPMGWGGMDLVSVMLSLSVSSTEKQDIVDNWSNKWSAIIPNSTHIVFNEENVAFYKSCSYDQKLDKYLSNGSVGSCDLYVFDHGYNDAIPTYGFTEMVEDPSTYSDRTYFIGAMDFLVRRILDDNPKAKIIIVGHYNNTADAFDRGVNFSGTKCCEGQKNYAELWGFPLIETWSLLGLTMRTIDTDVPVIYARYPDHLHPDSDTTGKELNKYADALVPYIENVLK